MIERHTEWSRSPHASWPMTLVLALTLGLSGCIERRPPAPDGPELTADAGAEPEPEPEPPEPEPPEPEPPQPEPPEPEPPEPEPPEPEPPEPEPPEPEPEPDRDCHLEVTRVPTDGFDLYGYEPQIAGGEVYLHRRGPDGGLRAVRASDGQPAGGPLDLLVAAGGGAMLLQRPDGAGGQRLIYRDAGGDRPLSEGIRLDGGDWFGTSKGWVEPGQAVWISGGRLSRWADGEVEGISARALHATVEDGWLMYVDTSRITWLIAGDEQPARGRLLGSVDEHPAVIRGGWVWGIEGTTPWRAPVGGEATPLAGWDRCTKVDGDGPAGVAVCVTDAGPNSLVYFPPEGAPRLIAEQAYIDGVTIRGDVVWWGGWDDPGAWCGAFEPGALYRARLGPDGLAGPIERVDAIVPGCLCCGAQWPVFSLESEGGVAAWNYAGTRDAPAIGIAREVCD